MDGCLSPAKRPLVTLSNCLKRALTHVGNWTAQIVPCLCRQVFIKYFPIFKSDRTF